MLDFFDADWPASIDEDDRDFEDQVAVRHLAYMEEFEYLFEHMESTFICVGVQAYERVKTAQWYSWKGPEQPITHFSEDLQNSPLLWTVSSIMRTLGT